LEYDIINVEEKGSLMHKRNTELFNKIISKVHGDLLPLPTTINELVKLDIDNVTASDISAVIEKDPALVAKVLRLANSAYYGLTQRVTTITHAIVCLGFNKVKSLAYTAASQQVLKNGLESYGMKENELFEHCVAVAIGSRLLSEKIGMSAPEEHYIMGLLHDVGKLMVDQFAAEELKMTWELYRKGSLKMYQAEEESLGFHHGNIGAEIAKKWNFPNELCEVIEYHHNPDRADIRSMKSAYVVYIADGIAKTLEIGKGIVPHQDTKLEMEGIFSEKNLAILNISKEAILDVRKIIVEKVKEILQEIES